MKLGATYHTPNSNHHTPAPKNANIVLPPQRQDNRAPEARLVQDVFVYTRSLDSSVYPEHVG